MNTDTMAAYPALRPTTIYTATNAVACRGQPLSELILWVGRQWAVTVYGIERRDGFYVIEADRLFEVGSLGGWEEVMRRKGGVDLADFRAALAWARANAAALDASLSDGEEAHA